jgi:hypothetical protein
MMAFEIAAAFPAKVSSTLRIVFCGRKKFGVLPKQLFLQLEAVVPMCRHHQGDQI